MEKELNCPRKNKENNIQIEKNEHEQSFPGLNRSKEKLPTGGLPVGRPNISKLG